MLDHPYAALLGRVERPGRYVGGEFGALPVPARADLRIALAFPDAYEIGMSHIGLAVLYELAGALPGIGVERVFMPWPDMEALLREHDLPLVSLEAARPLAEFDVVGFSLQYELNYTNLLAMLDLGRIPRRAAERGERDPLVIVGGPLAAHAEPLAPFVDLALVGDGEEALPDLLEQLARARRQGLDRRETIDRLDTRPSVYAPGLLIRRRDELTGRTVVDEPTPVARRAVVEDLGRFAAGRGPVPTVSAVFDRYSVEIARGCAEGCRFCQAGFLYRPVRERTVAQVAAATDRACAGLGFDEVSLASLSSADHSLIGPLLRELDARFTARGVSLSVPSLRAYGLPAELVEIVGRLRATGVTLAPEAGSQRLRDAINKNVTEAELFAAADRFFAHGFRRIKLYFMLGLPGETDADLEAIVDLAARLRAAGRRRLRGRGPDILVSVSTFVPKPFTPFEREPMIPLEEIERRQRLLARRGREARIEVRLHDPRLSRLEALFCRGGAELAAVLERATDGGARFDGWGEMFAADVWDAALAELDLPRLLGPIPDGARLPWDHVDAGLSRRFLQRELERARRGRATPPCGRYGADPAAADFVCHACGLDCAAEAVPLRERRATPTGDGGHPPAPAARAPRPRPEPPSSSAAPTKVRLTLAKRDGLAFVGHLDTMRHVERSLRRAGLEPFYTQGFHPKPKVESGPALPTGTAGLGELVDVWLIDPPPVPELIERLRRAAPRGLDVIEARIVAAGEKKLGRAVEAAEYVALVRCTRERAAAAVAELLAAPRLIVTRERKGTRREVDVRPFLRTAELLEARPASLPLPAAPDRVAIALGVALPGSGGARPSELLGAVLGAVADDAWIVRTKLLLG